MASLVSLDLLKPHPKNGEYFSEPTLEEYEEIKRSVAEQGIRDPLKVLPDYTVVAGHIRLRIAREFGLTHVPVEIWDVEPERAEYLRIADNEERRVCVDPVKKARRAEFLKRYWGVREGRPEKLGKNYPVSKSLDDVAEAVGETRENLKKLQAQRPHSAAAELGIYRQTEPDRRVLAGVPAGGGAKAPSCRPGHPGVCGLSVQEAQEPLAVEPWSEDRGFVASYFPNGVRRNGYMRFVRSRKEGGHGKRWCGIALDKR